MATTFDYYSKLVQNSEITADAAVDMSITLDGMARCLGNIHEEMYRARKAGEQALAIQQHLLQQQQIQSYLEELIYTAEKTLAEFRDPGTLVTPAQQYFLLTGLLKTIREEGISTAVIQGRDNKAAFEKCVKEATSLLKHLHDHTEVQEALAWEREHQRRLEDRRKKEEEEATRRQQQKEARRIEIQKRIEQLKASKKNLSCMRSRVE